MKELHLICNAHLDPVWQWDWNEGATAALATFYSAVEIADEYDYVFCHNEALLYEFIENYDPKLFARIQELVKKGKWHIMGGWYLQPDCNVPCGEGFIRQIECGLKYFKEKFDYRPTVAINVDSFGHTQGLVQILKKCGFNGYMFCRPMKELKELPAMHFNWIGLDGSVVKVMRCEDDTIYCSALGQAVSDIKRKMRPWENEDVGVAFWGIGNHGGGPSRKDLKEIAQFQKEMSEQGVNVLHSTPEQVIEALQTTAVVDEALQPVFVKCYSSDSRLKQKYAELETKLLITEKICVIAEKELGITYPVEMLAEAQKHMAMMQFHDVLAGTSVRIGEESSLRKADYALELLDKAFTKAFMALMNEYEKVTPDTYPLFAFNPHSYEYDGVVEGEFLMLNPLDSQGETGYELEITKDGKPVEYQVVKEDCSINFERRKRLAIKSTLSPMSVTKFDVAYKIGKKTVLDRTAQFDFENQDACVKFNQENGCLSSYQVQGKDYLCGNAFLPIAFEDNEDPWGWDMTTVGNNYQALQPKVTGRVIERGSVYTRLESVYELNKSEVQVRYTVYADKKYVDVDLSIVWNEEGKGLKLVVPFANKGKFIGQTAFGTQVYDENVEQCAQKFCGIDDGENVLSVYANYIGGCAVEDGKLYLTLLNASVYCAHPIGKLPLVDDKRCNEYMEKGRHFFSFRLGLDKRASLEKNALEFAQKPYVLNAYPHGDGKKVRDALVSLSNTDIVLTSLRKVDDDAYEIRLFNNLESMAACICTAFGKEMQLSFNKYEVKTLLYKNGSLTEQAGMLYQL